MFNDKKSLSLTTKNLIWEVWVWVVVGVLKKKLLPKKEGGGGE